MGFFVICLLKANNPDFFGIYLTSTQPMQVGRIGVPYSTSMNSGIFKNGDSLILGLQQLLWESCRRQKDVVAMLDEYTKKKNKQTNKQKKKKTLINSFVHPHLRWLPFDISCNPPIN